MSQALFLFVLIFSLLIPAPVFAKSKITVDNLLPVPKRLVLLSEKGFKTGRRVKVIDDTGNPELRRFMEDTSMSRSDDGDAVIMVKKGQVPESEDYELPGFPSEAYGLSVVRDTITIVSPESIGVTRATQTLRQLAADNPETIPSLLIVDWPAFKIRGFMHDIGRSYIPVEELKREIDLLSRFKVNVFHWHLTDNTGWRLESRSFPILVSDSVSARYPGKFYSCEDAREICDYALERGVMVIPEIDLPGHSAPFTKAMGHSMLTEGGRRELKVILKEVAELFSDSPYIHIGGDEIGFPDSYLLEMLDYVHSLGKKAVIWNRYNRPAKKVDPRIIPCDMTTNWATSGSLSPGVPNIDMRYNYTNHFDVFADVVGIYKSTVFGEEKGNPDIAGVISAAWNDTMTPSWHDIVRQNNIYANIIASASRAWKGGGERYIEEGGTVLPISGPDYDDFADWERRFIHHKSTTLAGVLDLIPYVRQSHVRWIYTDPIPNSGDPAVILPPEKFRTSEKMPVSFEVNGKEYNTHKACGAGIYLRHIWHPIVKGVLDKPEKGHTVYAWTYIYSPEEKEYGALIEFYTYSRSGNERGPERGCWDRRGSRIWLNNIEIPAPEWERPGAEILQDSADNGLTNENLTARPPVRIKLKKGWNKVFLKLPYADNGGTGREKWQFTFVVTDVKGKETPETIRYMKFADM